MGGWRERGVHSLTGLIVLDNMSNSSDSSGLLPASNWKKSKNCMLS